MDSFDRFEACTDPIPNWVGVTTRREFFGEDLAMVRSGRPPVDSEIFEWKDLVDAALAANKRFTFLELGAGYGRWTVNASAVARGLGLRTSLIAVEAEPTHFKWLRRHCRDNGVKAKLVRAAIAREAGRVQFGVGDPKDWYGQAIADGSWVPAQTRTVRAVTLSSLLKPIESVDLIHCDIQGAEADVFEEAAWRLDRVRRVHIGTHNAGAEARLRDLFDHLGWAKLNDYAAGSECETPMGRFKFQDGIQSWENQR